MHTKINFVPTYSEYRCPARRQSVSHSVVSNSLRPHGLQPIRLHRILQARILKWLAASFSRGSSSPRSPALQADPLPSEPPGKPPVYLYNGILFNHKKELSSEIHYDMMNLKNTLSERSQSQKTSSYMIPFIWSQKIH